MAVVYNRVDKIHPARHHCVRCGRLVPSILAIRVYCRECDDIEKQKRVAALSDGCMSGLTMEKK